MIWRPLRELGTRRVPEALLTSSSSNHERITCDATVRRRVAGCRGGGAAGCPSRRALFRNRPLFDAATNGVAAGVVGGRPAAQTLIVRNDHPPRHLFRDGRPAEQSRLAARDKMAARADAPANNGASGAHGHAGTAVAVAAVFCGLVAAGAAAGARHSEWNCPGTSY